MVVKVVALFCVCLSSFSITTTTSTTSHGTNCCFVVPDAFIFFQFCGEVGQAKRKEEKRRVDRHVEFTVG
ncbi:hypothetical protein E2C01_053492 [Portunus trituberculatus]|uniref:Secreted protein n=1 Tax=Portunus trituberculatus TaxID=210409 RepID=A0A5B7GPI4_PORTR|nr:hypothetical protein [Portunus trituberculatus]